jgi:hypothetical protein
MGSKIRYVQSVPECPRCSKLGQLYVSYRKTESGWTKYFVVKHRKSSYDQNRYRLFRSHGYTPDEAMKYSGYSKPIELPSCGFGPSYPAPIRGRIRGPNSKPKLRGHRMKMPRRPLDRSWSPNKVRVFLTEAEADEIRRKYASRQMTQPQLADKYRVAQSQISFIVNGKILRARESFPSTEEC